MYWLLGHCRFDVGAKCIYAHDATYLPESGWWADTARLDRIRAEFNNAVKAEPLDLGAGRVEESILAEAFVPLPWRRDLWAIATYSVQFRDRGFGFYQDDEYLCESDDEDAGRLNEFGFTEKVTMEMWGYGIKPWEDGAYVRTFFSHIGCLISEEGTLWDLQEMLRARRASNVNVQD